MNQDDRLGGIQIGHLSHSRCKDTVNFFGPSPHPIVSTYSQYIIAGFSRTALRPRQVHAAGVDLVLSPDRRALGSGTFVLWWQRWRSDQTNPLKKKKDKL